MKQRQPRSWRSMLPDGVTMERHEIAVALSQPADTVGGDGMLQWLNVSTPDGGGGPFLVLETERWAMDSDKEIDTFANVLKGILAEVTHEE